MTKPSISTKKGDQGDTSLMYGRQVPKDNLRVESYGSVDELIAALGLIRASIGDQSIKKDVLKIQKDMFLVNTELATTLYDNVRLPKERLGQAHINFLQSMLDDIEQKHDIKFDWAIPGENWTAALFDLARTICRRAERNVVALDRKQMLENRHILQYLNRLSDVLWLCARKEALDTKGK